MNQSHFLGNLTRDPELKQLANDKRVVNFDVAVNRRYKKGNKTENEVAYVPCEAWDTGADLIAKHFKKGDPIIVHGSIKQETWKDKTTGDNRSRLKLRVNSFDFVPGARKEKSQKPEDDQGGGDYQSDDDAVGNTGGDGDIPF